MPSETAEPAGPAPCGCLTCQDAWVKSLPADAPFSERIAGPGRRGWRYACEKCGNKRCPHHTNHILACTNSNRPSQPGSIYT